MWIIIIISITDGYSNSYKNKNKNKNENKYKIDIGNVNNDKNINWNGTCDKIHQGKKVNDGNNVSKFQNIKITFSTNDTGNHGLKRRIELVDDEPAFKR